MARSRSPDDTSKRFITPKENDMSSIRLPTSGLPDYASAMRLLAIKLSNSPPYSALAL
jgi:hypothetical protein